MDEQKYTPKYSRDEDPWDQGSWQTGSTRPPKDRGGTMALLLILGYQEGGSWVLKN